MTREYSTSTVPAPVHAIVSGERPSRLPTGCRTTSPPTVSYTAQPPRMTPYTDRLVMAKMNTMPMIDQR